MGDHDQARTRFSSTGLAFVRKVIIAVRTGGCLDNPLTCSEIYDLADEHGVDIPSLRHGDRQVGAQSIGRELGKLFKAEAEDEVEVEGFRITRTKERTARPDGDGYFSQNKYSFTALVAPEGDLANSTPSNAA
jgi:hypothetical protein